MIGAVLIYAGLFASSTISSSFSSTLTPVAASNSIQFTGNVSQNETVNITLVGTAYCFAINIAASASNYSANCALIEIGNLQNYSDRAYTNLSSAINNRATLSGLITATNSSSNTTIVTYDTTGVEGNTGTFTETLANGAWAASVMSGGVNGASAYSTMSGNINQAFVILGVALLLGGIGAIITVIFGFAKGRSGRE